MKSWKANPMPELALIQKPQALIFDMDGVILDSNPLHRVAWDEYNRQHGVEMTEAMYQTMYGKRNDEIIRSFLGNHLTDIEVFEHGAAKERLYRKLMTPRVESALVPGVAEFIRRHKDLPMAVATNGERANVDMALNGTGLAEFFRVAVTGADVVRPKPHPDIYLKAAELLHIAPENCIVFEDSHAGVQAGLSAGMRVVGIATTHDDLKGVELIVQDFNDSKLQTYVTTSLQTRPASC
jgi:beta-phosphoglucomutase